MKVSSIKMQVPKSAKYDQLISTARQLFWKHGIRRVTVEEICTEAQVSKMTFYRFFSNKIELAKIVLESVFVDSMQKYRHMMAQDIPFNEKIRQIILMKFEGTLEISQEFMIDIYKNGEPELIAFMAEVKDLSIKQFLDDMIDAQRQGWLRKDITPQFIMYFINQMDKMVTDESLLALYPNPQQLIMEITNFFFYGISPRD